MNSPACYFPICRLSSCGRRDSRSRPPHPRCRTEIVANMRLQLASRESNSRHRKCDLLAPTPSTTARCSAPTASTTGSLLEALALRCTALPVLCLPVHLARSGTPVLRRLSRAFGTLCPLLSTGLIGTTTTGFLVVLCLLLRVLRIRGTIYRVPTAVVV